MHKHNPKFRPPKTGYYLMCQVCGYKIHNSQIMMRWDKKLVCQADWEERHPQDTIQRPRTEKWPKIVSPEPEDRILTDQYPSGVVGVNDL